MKWISLLVCLAITKPASATLIVALWDQNHILLSADGRLSDSQRPITDNACKLVCAGSWHLVQAGMLGTSTNGLTTIGRVLEQTNSSTDVRQSLQKLQPIIAKELSHILRAGEKTNEAKLGWLLNRPTKEIIDVLVVGFDRGHPVVELTYWSWKREINGQLFAEAHFEDLAASRADQDIGLHFLGQNQAIKKQMAKSSELTSLAQTNPVTFIKKCFEIEVASKLPDDPTQGVGGSLELVEITATGTKRILKNPACGD